MRVCIVGAGPAGLFLAGRLVKRNPAASVSIIDARPAPFGLVKYGVAPDHPEVKNCISSFTDTLKGPNVKLFGNVKLGVDLSLEDLWEGHDAIVICTGMSQPRLLGVAGETLPNSFNAAQFVGWYNNVPEYQDLSISLKDVKRVAVIGHGNVALDVSRILLKPWEAFKATEMSLRALEVLSTSAVTSVDIVGRRGPLQMSFTISELREMFSIEGVSGKVDIDLLSSQIEKHSSIWRSHRPTSRIISLLENKLISGKVDDPSPTILERTKYWNLRFFASPQRIFGDGKVQGIVYERTAELSNEASTMEDLKGARTQGTGETFSLPYDMVISCIGFRGGPTFGLPSSREGVILNDNGRVLDRPGLYVCGWAGTGAEGELASTMRSAHSIADLILTDGAGISADQRHDQTILDTLSRRSIKYTPFECNNQSFG